MVEEKIIQTKGLDNYEIYTDDGWKDLTEVHKTKKYEVWELRLETRVLRCADEHIVVLSDGFQVYVCDLMVGDYVCVDGGIERVESVGSLGYEEHMYDVSVDSDSHLYYVQGILSHNTTVTTIYITHFALFNKHKNIYLIANKQDTAMEIMYRIQEAYKMLPLWLQQGVKEWSKLHVEFENGSRITAATTAPQSISGQSVGLLYIDELSKVPAHIAEEFMTATLPVISASKTAKIIATSCVTKKTHIFTTEGIKTIGEMVDDTKPIGDNGYEIPVYSIEGFDGLNSGNVLVNNGKKPIRRIVTSKAELECTDNHKLWSYKNGVYGWHKSEELDVGDYVCVKYGMNLWGNQDTINFVGAENSKYKFSFDMLTEDLCYMIGLYISEGYARQKDCCHQLVISCGDDISGAFDRIGLTYTKYDDVHYTANSKDFINFLQYLGFDISKKAKQKVIPERLMKMSKKNISAMLRGMFDGDGSAHKNRMAINLSSTSETLIDQTRAILLNMGILSGKGSQHTKPSKKVRVSSHVFNLEMVGEFAVKFYQDVGFGLERKQKRYADNINLINNNNCDVIPNIRKVMRSYHLSDFQFYKKIRKTGVFGAKMDMSNDAVNRKKLLKYKDQLIELGNPDINHILMNVSENYKWDKIKSITHSEDYVYDFSMASDPNDIHEFKNSVVYGGIVGHQTPLGAAGIWHAMWVKAASPDSSYHRIRVPWYLCYTEEFKRKTIADNGIQHWYQEYECRFLGAKDTLIEPESMELIETKDPIDLKYGGLLQIYEKPERGSKYVIGVDVATGVGGDYSCMQVFKVISNNHIVQCAVYRHNKISIPDYAQVCVAVGDYYNKAVLVIENNLGGGECADAVWYTYDYENVYNDDVKKIGVRATTRSKMVAVLNMKRYIENGWIELHDGETVRELSNFGEKKRGLFGALGSKQHDDLVAAMYWGLYYLISDDFVNDRGDVMDQLNKIDDKYIIEPEDDGGGDSPMEFQFSD